MTRLGWTGRLKDIAALGAVAILLLHALALGWHVPPPLRALAALDVSVCHASEPDRKGSEQPASPSDHLAHCPLCLSADGGTLFGPAHGPELPSPGRRVSIAFLPPASALPADGGRAAFSARGPPLAA